MLVPAKSASLSNNAVINGLMLGGAWSGPTITYGFKAGDMNRNGVNDFDEGDWKEFHRELLANVESFANVKFQETSERGNINFRLDEGGGGESGVPQQGVTDVETAVGIDPNVAASAAVVRLGTYSVTWFHELGHGLGLKHPHDDEGGGFPKLPGVEGPGDKGTTYLNSQLNTVMGYTYSFLAEDNPFTVAVDFGTEVRAQPGSFGAIDVAALQFLYGARDHNTGNDIYRFSDDVDFNHGYTTIWDTGGSDTIEYVGTNRTKIDLRAATLKNEIGGGGWISTSETLTGGFTIANGVTIENAKGNVADDILIGNDAANRLSGLGGNDVLRGMAGDDQLDGGDGNDTLDGGAGIDSAIYRNAFSAYSIQRDGATTVIAGEGVDRLQFVEKAVFSDGVYDLVRGVFEPNTSPSVNVRTGTEQKDTLVAPDASGWTLDGLGGDDVLIGNNGADRLQGGSGNDRLDGRGGADRMIGGSGNDYYLVDDARDVVVEQAGEGRDIVESTVSYKLGANIEYLYLVGRGTIDGTGNDLTNAVIGNESDNVLEGNGGNDVMNGAGGNDRLIGGAGLDQLRGGRGADVFVFRNGDTGATAATADAIWDFQKGDRIDLTGMIAKAGAPLDFIGANAFTGSSGDVRFRQADGATFVEGDLDGDGRADFVIKLDHGPSLTADDFLL